MAEIFTHEQMLEQFRDTADFTVRRLRCEGQTLWAYAIDGLTSGGDISEYVFRPVTEHLRGATAEALYTEAFSEGRLKGYDEGLNEGLLQGAAQGQNTALTAAGDTYTQGYDEGYAQGYAKKEKDDQAARDRYLASLQASLPVVTPIVDTTGSDRSLPTIEPDEEPTSQTVYVTKSGTKYHLGSCSHLSKSKIEKSLSEAKNAGFEPCKTCNPPK